jgi:abhydrolase domain-containing protein 17
MEIAGSSRTRAGRPWNNATTRVVTGLSFFLLVSCTPLINRVAFHPEMAREVAAGHTPSGVEQRFITTPDKVRLRCLLVRDTASHYAALYFHGNASTIDQNLEDLLQISKMGLTVFGVEYRGFGQNQGHPSEKGVYADGLAGFRYVVDSLKFDAENIFIIGVSIGTAVADKTAAGNDIAGLVLVAPLTTGRSYAWIHGLGLLALAAGSSFDNKDNIRKIKCPLLVIHGSDDRLIPVSMGKKVFANATCQKEFVEIKGGHHDDLSIVDPEEYWGSIERFFNAVRVNSPFQTPVR